MFRSDPIGLQCLQELKFSQTVLCLLGLHNQAQVEITFLTGGEEVIGEVSGF
jgi:hypothetical protein